VTSAEEPPLADWAERLWRHGADKLTRSISATSLVKERPGFGTSVRPAKGSVLASPSAGDPDYFFHWLRDSAAVMDAVRLLIRRGENAGEWKARFEEFIDFSLGLRALSGPDFLAREAGFRERAEPWFRQYVRPDEEIAAVQGDRVLGEARYNADGAFDFIRWNRPQHDGPAARALTAMRFLDDGFAEGEARRRAEDLIRGDLAYTASHAGAVGYDIWEEEPAQHFYTALVQYAALEHGARFEEATGRKGRAAILRERANGLIALLDRFWSEKSGFIHSRLPGEGVDPEKALDFAVILGVIHAGLKSGPHSVQGPRVRATFAKLEALFGGLYGLNRGRASGILFGRYKDDRYISGGAYYFSTFGAAEYYYRLAAASPSEAAELIAKGDAILARTREFIPASLDLTEQLDQTTGEQTSAMDLSWSYACFITAWEARREAIGAGNPT
jgi:glucoamylase